MFEDTRYSGEVERARRYFSRLANLLRQRILWADDKLSPIPYTLNCDCMHQWVDTPKIHDVDCPLYALGQP